MRKHCRQLGAGPRGARTTRLRRPRHVPLVSQHVRVHRIPASRVVTTAIRPSEKRGGMSAIYGKSELRKTEIFRCEGLDTIPRRAPVGQINCPWYRLLSGQSGRQMVGKTPRAQSKITQCMVRPRVARGFRRSRQDNGLASMYPASAWSVCSGPSWISARIRSD